MLAALTLPNAIAALSTTLEDARAVTFVHTLGFDYLIAIYLGLTTTGYYRAGNRISGSVAEILNEPLRYLWEDE